MKCGKIILLTGRSMKVRLDRSRQDQRIMKGV